MGLPHPERCLLCDEGEEDIQHLMVGCVFTRQFWFLLQQHVSLAVLAPQPTDSCFEDWWEKFELLVNGDMRAG